jgi:hypothetical protein
LTEVADDVAGMLLVVDYLREHPRPGVFARELPLPLDTKFVERNQRILREWLDIVLPPHAIRADERHFERRYGLRYADRGERRPRSGLSLFSSSESCRRTRSPAVAGAAQRVRSEAVGTGDDTVHRDSTVNQVNRVASMRRTDASVTNGPIAIDLLQQEESSETGPPPDRPRRPGARRLAIFGP